MIMNMMNKLVMLCVAAAVVLVSALTSCSDNGPLDTPHPGEHTLAMRFTTCDASASRTVHSGLGSTFIEGKPWVA